MTGPALRLVLDTNVLVSALRFPFGAVSWLRGAWQSGAIVPLVNAETARELTLTLAYPKFRLTEDERADLLAEFLPWCKTVTEETTDPVPDCRDPADRPFLELALAGRADALVTGDGDLLTLAETFSVPILTPFALKGRMGHGEAVHDAPQPYAVRPVVTADSPAG